MRRSKFVFVLVSALVASLTMSIVGTSAAHAASSPAITYITPPQGLVGGGDTIHIIGSDFQAGATVTIGSNACTLIRVVSLTEITCVTPVSTLSGDGSGAVDVTVTNTDSGTSTLGAINAFSYTSGPITFTADKTTLSLGDTTNLTGYLSPNLAAAVWINGVPVSPPSGPVGPVELLFSSPVPWELFALDFGSPPYGDGGCTTTTVVFKIYNQNWQVALNPLLTDTSAATLTITALGSPTYCNSITTSVVGSGTIDPSQPNITTESQVIHFAPTNGATVRSITIDGAPDPNQAADITNGFHTFYSSSPPQQHTIVVTFTGGNDAAKAAADAAAAAKAKQDQDITAIVSSIVGAVGAITSGVVGLAATVEKNRRTPASAFKKIAKKVKKAKKKK